MHTSTVCCLGVLAYLDMSLGSAGSTLSKATLLSKAAASGVREQTNKQTSKPAQATRTAVSVRVRLCLNGAYFSSDLAKAG